MVLEAKESAVRKIEKIVRNRAREGGTATNFEFIQFIHSSNPLKVYRRHTSMSGRRGQCDKCETSKLPQLI